MLQFCLVDVQSLVAYLLPLPLSYPKKESWQAQGRKQKPVQIHICENSLVRLHKCEFAYVISLYAFIYVNSYSLQIHLIWIIFSSIVHKGYFHGQDNVTLHDDTIVTVPVFDMNEMLRSLLTDRTIMVDTNFAEGYDVLTWGVDVSNLSNDK